MPNNPIDDSEALPASTIIPEPAHLWQYPTYDLIAWQPQGVLDDRLLDEIGEWLCAIEETSPPSKRFIDLSRLTMVAVRTSHVFNFARKRAEQFAGDRPVKSALFSEDWVGFGDCPPIRKSDEGNVDRGVRISRPRQGSRLAGCADGHFETQR